MLNISSAKNSTYSPSYLRKDVVIFWTFMGIVFANASTVLNWAFCVSNFHVRIECET
jgi:hypothetical protein